MTMSDKKTMVDEVPAFPESPFTLCDTKGFKNLAAINSGENDISGLSTVYMLPGGGFVPTNAFAAPLNSTISVRVVDPNDPTMNTYQEEAAKTAIYPREAAVVYPMLGLIGEVGEMADKLMVALFPAGQNINPGVESNVFSALLRAAQAGSRAETLKKQIRGGAIPVEQLAPLTRRVAAIAEEEMSGIRKEGGDGLWYIANVVRDLGVKLGDIAKTNLDKLASRQQRGVLHGSGDNR
jgi:hypothetical protein